jgi:hypothetical protein
MTTDDAAHAEAWADYAQTAHLRARPEPAGDRSALVQRFFLCRTRIVSLLTDMDECFQAAAPAPAEARLEPAGDRVEAACRELHEWWDNPNVPDSVRVQPRRDVSRALAAADALTPPPAVPDEVLRDAIGLILRDVAELPDRTSPDDWPEAMLITAGELGIIVDKHIRSLLAAPAQPAEDGTKVAARFVLRGLREALSSASEYVDGLADYIERDVAPAQPGAGSHLTSVATTSGSSPVAPAQSPSPRQALEERAAAGDELAVPLWNGPARSAWDAKDRRIRELEEALRGLIEDIDISTERWADSNACPATVSLVLGDLPVSQEAYDRARALIQGDDDADRR